MLSTLRVGISTWLRLPTADISESYARANGTDLSEKEITKFLQANSRAKWVPVNTGRERRFKTSDGSAEATYGILNGRPALTVRALNP